MKQSGACWLFWAQGLLESGVLVWWEAAGNVGDETTCEVLSAAAGVTAFTVHRRAGGQAASQPQTKSGPQGGSRTLMTDEEGLVQAGPGGGREA